MTDSRVELTEDEKAILDGRLRMILEMLDERPEVSICYFEPDAKKAGGAYVTITGHVKTFDEISKMLILEDEAAISLESILKIEFCPQQIGESI